MKQETIRGYRVEHEIDPQQARKLVEFFLDFDMRCTDGSHAIMKINDTRIRFKYEGMKRGYIEIKELGIFTSEIYKSLRTD